MGLDEGGIGDWGWCISYAEMGGSWLFVMLEGGSVMILRAGGVLI